MCIFPILICVDHAINISRFCLQSNDTRIHKADLGIFSTVAKYAARVPLIVVATKKDEVWKTKFADAIYGNYQSPSQGNLYSTAVEAAEQEANRELDKKLSEIRAYLEEKSSHKADDYILVSKGTKD